jgi:hypothetical protein
LSLLISLYYASVEEIGRERWTDGLTNLVECIYGLELAKMSISGSCSAGTHVGNYSATNVPTTQKDKLTLSSKRRPNFETHKRYWNEHKLAHGFCHDLEPRTTVLVKASSNLLDWTGEEAFVFTKFLVLARMNVLQ